MIFSPGDYIALSVLALGVLGFIIRERRAGETRIAAEASVDANIASLVTLLSKKQEEIIELLNTLEAKRQKHEIGCARIQERTAAAMERTVAKLDEHDRAIDNLRAQMAHIASGGAGTVREIG